MSLLIENMAKAFYRHGNPNSWDEAEKHEKDHARGYAIAMLASITKPSMDMAGRPKSAIPAEMWEEMVMIELRSVCRSYADVIGKCPDLEARLSSVLATTP